MQLPRVTLFLTLLCAVSAIEARATNQEYDWTGGAAGFSGKIVLDSNSNANGTLADIVSAQITTPHETVVFDPYWVYYSQPKFAWNSSQITDMWIFWYWFNTGGDAANFGANTDGKGTNELFVEDATGAVRYDLTGSWTAAAPSSVPDATSTGMLFVLGIASLVVMKKKRALG